VLYMAVALQHACELRKAEAAAGEAAASAWLASGTAGEGQMDETGLSPTAPSRSCRQRIPAHATRPTNSSLDSSALYLSLAHMPLSYPWCRDAPMPTRPGGRPPGIGQSGVHEREAHGIHMHKTLARGFRPFEPGLSEAHRRPALIRARARRDSGPPAVGG
jgi:hypothetical protein